MAYSGYNDKQPGGRLPDGISCVGVLLLITLVLSVLGASLGAVASGGGKQVNQAIRATSSPPAIRAMPRLALVEANQLATPVGRPTTSFNPTPIERSSPVPSPSQTPAEEPIRVPSPLEEPAIITSATPAPALLPTPHGTYSFTFNLPILMYHYISNPPEDADEYRLDLSVSPEAFREQMQFLVNNGYQAIDLYDLSLAIAGKVELPAKPVVITLDDGYRDNYENAFPILWELGLKATFFIPTDFIDQNIPTYMNWTMIEEMAAAGMRFEPHSKTHPNLTEHERDFIIWEVLGSQETLAAHIGSRPRYFAYPGGRYNDEVKQIVAELDFWGAVTTAGGFSHGYNDRFDWPRVRIRNSTTISEFAFLVK